MKIKRSKDFPQDWCGGELEKADFIADKFEEECIKQGVNPEHPRLEGYVVMDRKMPKLAIHAKRIAGGLGVFQRFNQSEVADAVDFALGCVRRLEKLDQSEEELAKVEELFKESFKVRREPGSAELLISPKTDDRLRMSAKLYCFLLRVVGEKMDQMDATGVNLKLEVTLSLRDAIALCKEAFQRAVVT